MDAHPGIDRPEPQDRPEPAAARPGASPCPRSTAASLAELGGDAARRLLHELQEQNRRFLVAVDNMPQGLCFFDGSHKLILCNRPYAELYDLRFEALVPGTTLREIVEMRHAAGSTPRMPAAEYVAWRDRVAVVNRRQESTVTLRNGRVISILHQPMPDGGWVATHEDVTERRRVEATALHLARNDLLTGVCNRASFLDHLARATSGLPHGRVVAVLCLDVDRFKEVNETFGHAAGDRLLREAAARIQEEVRDTDVVARLGGDEFAAILGGLRDAAETEAAAVRIAAAISAPYRLDGQEVVVSLSVGAALGGDAELLHDPEQLLRRAELALAGAKAGGGGLHRMYDPGMDRTHQVRKLRERELGDAIAGGRMELHFQPQMGAGTGGCLAGTEALVRWRGRSGELIPPGEFIPLAEETGLIVPLGEWVLRTACAQARRWPGVTVAANLSALQLRRPGFAELLEDILVEMGFDPSRLELEITETAILHDTEATIATLQRVRRLGVRISMDDFGTGYSSLSYLRRFAFDKLKIDRSFVRDLRLSGEQGMQARAIVQAIIGLSRTMGMRTVAEGVETTEQARMLTEDGCDALQGYLFGRPVDAAEFERTHLAAARHAPLPCSG